MSMKMLRVRGGILSVFGMSLLLLSSGCAQEWGVGDDDSSASDDDDAGDDDDSAGDDDDSSGDDDDDTSSGDDDDSQGTGDYDQASVPTIDNCEPNRFVVQLGDGSTTIGPISGYFDSGQESFANTWGNFQFKMGETAVWAQIRGHADGMTAASEISLTTPHDTPGNVIVEVSIEPSQVSGDASVLAGSYGFPATNRDDRVQGFVEFDAVPQAGGSSQGRFEAILQVADPLGINPIKLLGIAGCFDVTLLPQG